ncbi:MAG: alpha-1,2-fucosyltransferase [Chlamydiota bacterium]
MGLCDGYRKKIIGGVCGVCLLLQSPLAADSDIVQPFVTCNLMGGLGNLLFEAAATLAYAWDHNAVPYFPALNSQEHDLIFHRDHIFQRLNPSAPPRPLLNAFKEPTWYNSDKIPFRPDQKLLGYYQSWKHFDHHREKILATFAPSEEVLEGLKTEYAELLATPQTVAIHVRTFNREMHESKMYPFLGLDYYKRAIDQFPSNATFVVFSDRINWCKIHFPQLHALSETKRKFVFIEGNDPSRDLFLMSMMEHAILSNSTFSWWAAYLSTHPQAKVIVPRYWAHPDFHAFPAEYPNDFYLPQWIPLPVAFDTPYPIDMTWYGNTISFDGN